MRAMELRDVTFTYEGGEAPVLRHANMQVEYGEVALLSGFSGEGKSTVLSLIAGIIPNMTPGEFTGDVLLDGKSVLGEKTDVLCRKVGMVLQNAESQIVQQIVEDEISFGCENFAFPKEQITQRIEKACGEMKLEPQWNTRTLSGGQKQRLMTAATLATGQKILVFDEPLANLDKAGGVLLMSALRRLAKAGCAVLIVEHRLDMVLPFVDSVWHIQNGTIRKIEDKRTYLSSQAALIGDDCPAIPTGRAVFQVEHLSFTAGNREILADLSLEVLAGERLLLLGENGCGKTTLLRLLARLCKPTKGWVIQSIDPSLGQRTKGSGKWFRKVGVVYQNPNYQLFMPTVQQEIAYGARSAAYGEEIMELFRLTPLADRHPQSLSEGQKRRVSIAAVAVSEPEVLLLDEPTVGQDYAGLRELVRVLNLLHQRTGNTMITVTHDMRCAQALCDWAALLQNGRISKVGGKELAREYFSIALKP